MQNETTAEAFREYGFAYKRMSDEKRESMICQTITAAERSSISRFLKFSCDSYLEVRSGSGIVLVSHDPQEGRIDRFGLSQRVHIRPNIYFALIAEGAELTVSLYVESGHSLDALLLDTPWEYRPVLPQVRVREIRSCCYRIRTPDHRFRAETHPFFELVYVDPGVLHTEVEGVSRTVSEREMILYGPGQLHRQYTGGESVSCLSIGFTMENLTPGMSERWYEVLLGKVHPYNKKTHGLLKTLIQESSAGTPYADSLMRCLLTETIIRLLQSGYAASAVSPAAAARQNYRDELFERIVAYVESKIYEPLTVAEICQQFSMSRSSLQLLFKNAVGQSPKRFINDMKLEKSRQMLRENKYTVSEISLKLGYSSIHYFSNAFNQRYHISPSEYAKRIY